jgi:hypothetical protein
MLPDFIKNIIKKILYNNITHFYQEKYINYRNIKNNFYYKKKIFKKKDYIYFLIKKTRQYNISDRILKKIYISVYTIIHELSADCSQRNIGVIIENHLQNLTLKSLIKIFKNSLPTGFNIELKEKNNSIFLIQKNKDVKNKYKILINYKKRVINHDYLIFNIIINKNKKNIKSIEKIKPQKKVICKYQKNNEQFYSNISYHKKIIKSYNRFLKSQIKKFTVKKEMFFFCSYSIVTKSNIINKKKIYFNKNNFNKVLIVNNAIISYRGLIAVNDFLIKESINHSIWDNNFKIKQNVISIPKVTKIIDSKAILFPTASNNIAHYTHESLIRLMYVKNIHEYKIIVFDRLSDYLREILLALGINNKQILQKKIYESWQIKELLFPIIPWFEVSKKESKFLSNSIINKKNTLLNHKYEKIYISRQDNTENRNLINEKELELFLQSQGFKIIIASKLSIYEKINIFEKAKIIITPLGSAIHNFMFCKNISAKIIMIGTSKYFIKDFIQYAYLKNLKIYFLEANEIPSYTKAWQYNHSSFFLNLDTLNKALRNILNN